ncbi:MAG: TonB-dependent receptor plug domain-containing protein [Xanthomonadaceae bacterium]|nr:TonB-dependent receptor plug domain-containing protein [Xanthomonadaceae bacterium]
MKHKRNPIAAAVNYALGAGALAGMVMTSAPAFAQEEDTALEQRVQVTGSRIKRVDVETTSPVTIVTSEQILASGLQNVGDVLRNLNQADSLGLSNLTNSTNGNDGTQTISLRGLGSTRTLVLVNGRRWIGLGGGQVDITQIPVALVERIEVLADGASAIYGSDAIAGVINIITRDDYDGLEVEMSLGASFEGDGEVTTVGATLGVSGSRSSTYFNVSKTEQQSIGAGDRAISEFPVQFVPLAFGSSFSEYGRFAAPGFSTVTLRQDREIEGLQPQDRTPQDFIPLTSDNAFNFAPENYLLTPSDRLTAFAGGHFDVTDNVRAYAQFTYNQRKSETRIASVPLTIGVSGPQWAFPYSAQNIYNPFGIDLTQIGFRTTPLGPRTNIQDFDTYFGTGGLEGFFTFADRTIDWDVFYSRGEASRFSRGINFVNLLNLSRAMGPSFIDAGGNRLCGTPGNVIAGCVPINFFNGISGVTVAMAEYIRGDLNQQEKSGIVNYGVNFTGDIIDMPAGALLSGLADRRGSELHELPRAHEWRAAGRRVLR